MCLRRIDILYTDFMKVLIMILFRKLSSLITFSLIFLIKIESISRFGCSYSIMTSHRQ